MVELVRVEVRDLKVHDRAGGRMWRLGAPVGRGDVLVLPMRTAMVARSEIPTELRSALELSIGEAASMMPWVVRSHLWVLGLPPGVFLVGMPVVSMLFAARG